MLAYLEQVRNNLKTAGMQKPRKRYGACILELITEASNEETLPGELIKLHIQDSTVRRCTGTRRYLTRHFIGTAHFSTIAALSLNNVVCVLTGIGLVFVRDIQSSAAIQRTYWLREVTTWASKVKFIFVFD